MRPGLDRPTAGYLLKVSLSAPELLCRAGRKCGHQLVLSVLLLPGGDGEDDIDIGVGVLVLVLGGVPGPGHGGGVVVRGGSAGHLWLVPIGH